MNYQLLASIDPNRQITHESGQVVYINWDGHQFRLMRSDFSHFAHALEQGLKQLYASEKRYSVVHVDDDLLEVWIENSCLSMTWREYRALLNATLTTETRLHGFRTPQDDEISIKTIAPSYRPPSPINFHWN
jgi:hypothetical protein